MGIVGGIADIYAGAAETAALMWVLQARCPRRSNAWDWKIALWFLAKMLQSYLKILPGAGDALLGAVLSFGFALWLLQGRWQEKAGIVAASGVFMLLTELVGRSAVAMFGGVDVAELTASGSVEMIHVITKVMITFVYLLTAYMVSGYLKKGIRLKKTETQILVIFYSLFFIIAILSIAVLEAIKLPWWWQAAFLALDILMFVANGIIWYFLRYMNEQNQYEIENTVLKMQLASQEAHIRQEEKANWEVRTLRHDMKNYFVTYLQLMKEGKYELVEQDMEKVLGEKLEAASHVYTKNRILNVILNEKAEQCRKEKINLKLSITECPETESMDMGILVANLIDNAMEAEHVLPEEQRVIKLTISRMGEMLHIIVSNYIAKSVLDENPALHTTKENGREHGIGLKSVREIVRRKDGEIDIFEEENQFIVHICMSV